MKTYQLFINGEYVDPADGVWIDTIDPYRGEPWARIPRSSSKDVDRAVAAARKAMDAASWSDLSPSARGKLMRRLGDLVAKNAEKLAAIEVKDNGKLYTEMFAQLSYHPEWWYYFGGLADKLEGTVPSIDKPDMLAMTRQEPVGVVAAITPWNSPLLCVAFKCAPAIAAGCSVIVKPSEFASASTLEFAALTKEAGFPDGVFNVITGLGNEVGQSLVEHPGVSKITFTGSDVTGANVYAQAAKGMKRVSLELGGKSANIVFDDADIDAAIPGALSGVFAASGQTCIAGSRLLVQKSIKSAFVERLCAVAGQAKLGDPMLATTNIGPVTTPPQFQKVMSYIEIAKSEGARCVLGGRAASGEGITGGQFVEPTIFDNVTNQMRIAREEVFGPVVSVIGFDDEADAIKIANDSIYGLAAGVWTRDIGRVVRMSKALKAGTVWVNTYRAVSYMMPFGGVKFSGVGRENGLHAIQEFLETKSIWISAAAVPPSNPYIMRL